MQTHVVTLKGNRKGRFSAHYEGQQITPLCRDASHEAARVLRDRGLTGTMKTFHEDGSPSMIYRDLVKAADWTVIEDSKRGLKRVKFRRDWASQMAPRMVSSRSRAVSRARQVQSHRIMEKAV